MSGLDEDVENEWFKRAALTGQWRTPPMPQYSATAPSETEEGGIGSSSQQLSESGTTSSIAAPASQHRQLSDPTADYVAALQDAYRRGAQAAAAMAASKQGFQGSNMTGFLSSASCPEFQKAPPNQDSFTQLPAVPNPLVRESQNSASMPPPPPPPVTNAPSEHPPLATIMHPPPAFPYVTPIPSPNPPTAPPPPGNHHHSRPPLPPPTPMPQQHHQQLYVHTLAQSQLQQQEQQPPQALLPPPLPPPPPPRAMSMPNMSFNIEEEKRLKRLARNRASARLRRMRKKNLVEAYEVEVGILEKSLEALKNHQWGDRDDPSALLEALSIDRGQQDLTAEERRQAALDILDQQLQFVELLEDGMREQYILHHLHEIGDEFQDLKELLQLTDDQYSRLEQSGAGWDEEWRALQTVKSSLQAMKGSKWLWNEGPDSIVQEFLSILHRSQISKLLLWADHNSESIDDLNLLYPSPNEHPDNFPVFQFGVNNNPDTLLDSGKTPNEPLF